MTSTGNMLRWGMDILRFWRYIFSICKKLDLGLQAIEFFCDLYRKDVIGLGWFDVDFLLKRNSLIWYWVPGVGGWPYSQYE